MPARKVSRIELEERLDHIEELLASGVPTGVVVRKQCGEWNLKRRQVENYIHRVYARWEKARAADAPFAQEKLRRKIERFYGKAMADKKYGPAAQILTLEARLSGIFDHPAARQSVLERLGQPPEDPGEALTYVRKVLMQALWEAQTSPNLDMKSRQHIVGDLAFKLCATQGRTEMEAAVLRIDRVLAARQDAPPAAEIVDAHFVTRPPTARG